MSYLLCLCVAEPYVHGQPGRDQGSGTPSTSEPPSHAGLLERWILMAAPSFWQPLLCMQLLLALHAPAST